MALLRIWFVVSTWLWLCCCIVASDSGDNLHEVLINPSANAVMGAVVQVQDRGMGLFGCGRPTKDGVVRVEAMRWMTETLNREWQNQTFLPNISIGVKVFDSCGRSRVAASHLGELLPMLRGDNQPADLEAAQPTLQLGLIDGAGLLSDGEVRDTLEHFQVPVVALDSDVTLVSAETRIKAMVAVATKMNWQQCIVVHDNDYYNTQMLHFVTRYELNEGQPFVADVKSFVPRYEISNYPDHVTENVETVDTILSAAQSEIPIMILIHPFGVPSFVEVLNQRLESSSSSNNNGSDRTLDKKLKLFFPNLLTHDDVDIFTVDVDLYSVAVFPNRLPEFDQYWIDRIRLLKIAPEPPSPEDKWFFDYISSGSYCTEHSSEHAFDCNEDDLDFAIRTQHVISAGQAVLTLAQALKQAWRTKCPHATCGATAVEESADDRGTEHESLLYPHSDRGWLRQPNTQLSLQLVKYNNSLTEGIVLAKIMVINPQDLLAIESNFKPYSTNSSNQDLNISLSTADSPSEISSTSTNESDRSDSGRRIDSSDRQLVSHRTAASEVNKDYSVLVPSRDNLYVAALFAVHKDTHGESLLRCSADEEDLDLGAVRQLEAFLWALKRVNAKNDLELGAILLDTCNSRLRTMTLTAGLDSQHVLAAVNALPTTEASLAEEIMAAINITSVATGHALALASTSAPSPYILQVEAPISAIVSSIVTVLKHLGWTYVSVVYSDDAEYSAGFKQFKTAAARAEICLALQEPISNNNEMKSLGARMTELVPRLVGARADGARAVLLWTTADHTQRLMNAISHAVALGTVSREDFFWMVASPNGDGQHVMKQFGNVLGGALVFRPQHRPIREFQHHLQQVHAGSRDPSINNNPWLEKYYEKCDDIECLFHLETSNPSDMNAVQAVYAIGAAVSRARTQLCANATSTRPVDGLCSEQHSRFQLQQILNTNLRRSVTERADGASNENFLFTQSGAGNVATEILNFRRKSNEMSRSLKNIYFERVGMWSDKLIRDLLPMVAYRDSGVEIAVSGLASQCRSSSCCSAPSDTDRLSIEPAAGSKAPVLYVAATFAVHEPSPNPLECGGEVNREGMEQLEAFLWAVDQVNMNKSHVGLAAVALDTCGSIVKTSRAVTDLLSSTSNKPVVALISGGGTEFSNPLLDVIGHLRVPVLYAKSGGPSAHRKTHPPYPLQLAPSGLVQTAALLALVRQLGKKCFNVLYSQDDGEFEEMFKNIESQVSTSGAGVKLTGTSLPASSSNITEIVRESLGHTSRLGANSTALVVLLVPASRLDLVFRTVRALDERGLLTASHVSWITLDSGQALEVYSSLSLGALALRSKASRVSEFETYFGRLSLANNTRNPWFPELWSSVFHCRGATCHSQLFPDLHSYQLKHTSAVVNTINAVLAVAHALESVQRDLCPESSVGSAGMCAAVQNVARVRGRLFEVAPRMAFVGVGMNAIAFSNTGENAHAGVEVLNLQPTGLKSVGFVESNGVAQLNTSQINAYVGANRTEILLRDVRTYCLGRRSSVTRDSPRVIEIPSNQHFSLLGIVAVGEPGPNMFDCGKPRPVADLHLAALRFALDSINLNSSLLPGIQLGLTVLDTCSRPTTAHNAVYNYLSSSDTDGHLNSESIVTAVTLDESSADTVAPLLDAHNITQLVVSASPLRHVSTSYKLYNSSHKNKTELSATTSDNLVEAVFSLARSLNSHSYSIVRGDTKKHEYLVQRLQNQTLSESICLAGVHTLRAGNNTDAMSWNITDAITLMLKPGTLVILLLDDPVQVQGFLRVAKTFHSLVFLIVVQSRHMALDAGTNTVLTLSPSYQTDQHVSDMVKAFTKSSNLQQANTLQQSNDVQQTRSSIKLVTRGSGQSSVPLERIMGSIWIVAKGLHNVLQHHCKSHFNVVFFSECQVNNGTRNISRILEEEIYKEFPSVAYDVWNQNERVGTWKRHSGLNVIAQLPKFTSDCTSRDCTACSVTKRRSSNNRPPLYYNLQYPYAAALGGLALLGAFLTILTTIYFLAAAALPNHNLAGGTSALGYLILLGLMLSFTANLSFVLLPTEVTCGVRRFLPGLAYAIVFAGMLLKVFTTWRYETIIERDRDALSRPAGLLVAAIVISLVQILLSGGWLILIPPRVHVVPSLPEAPAWQCYPAGNFEAHLLLSMTYIILLLTMTATFALLCYSSSKQKLMEEWSGEARWILTACLLVGGVMTAWGIATIAFLPRTQADLATALAHLTTAYVLLLCLYVPKVCLYSRIKSKKRETPNNLRQIYDITHFQPSTLKTLPSFATPILGLDIPEVDEDLLNDPTQVVPSLLYSLAMFNAGDDEADEEEAGHCEPGTNEFTAPIQHSNPLLVLTLDTDPLQESISYM